jgi:hypothetical protein
MADTTSAPNNKPVTFRGKPEREASTPARPKISKATKKRAKGAINRGLVSEKAAKRHLGDF